MTIPEPQKPQRLTGHYLGMIFGPPGVGKTTLAGSAPNPIHLDTGNESLIYAYTEGMENITIYKIDSHQTLMEVLMAVRTGRIKCTTVIIDNMSDDNRLQLAHSAKKLKTGRQFADEIIPIKQDYGIAFAAIGSLLDLVKEHRFPADVLMLAHRREVTSKDGDSIVAVRAGLNPQLADRMLGAVDFCLCMTKDVRTHQGVTTVKRTLRANPTNIIEAKNRIGLPDEFPAEDLWKMIESRRDAS